MLKRVFTGTSETCDEHMAATFPDERRCENAVSPGNAPRLGS